MKRKLFTTVCAVIIACGSVFAKTNYNVMTTANELNSSNLSGYVMQVPAGITCKVLLSQGLNSNSAVVGQQVEAIITEDISYKGELVASSGSVISGVVVQNQKASFGDRNAKMMVKFTTIRTPYNNIIPVSGVFLTSDNTGVLKGGTKADSAKDYTKNTVVGAGAGAALGTALGAMAGGSVGKGAIYGTALGAGLGVVKGIATKGESITIPANSEMEVLFNQPITLGAQ